jgi:hypothetical protein
MKVAMFFLVLSPLAFAFPKLDQSTLKQLKEKGCPMVNGKKDCTVEEIKVKALDLKKKIKF